MKKILLLMGFCCTVTLVNAQAPDHGFQDSQHKTLAVVHNATVYNSDNKVLAQFNRSAKIGDNGITIKNGQSQDIGYILPSGNTSEFKDANHNTIGYVQFDRSTYIGTVKDGSSRVLGYIKPGGIIENGSHSVIGYGVSVEPVWSAAYYFLMKF